MLHRKNNQSNIQTARDNLSSRNIYASIRNNYLAEYDHICTNISLLILRIRQKQHRPSE